MVHSSHSSVEKVDEKSTSPQILEVSQSDVDVAAGLVVGDVEPVEPAEALRIKRKIDKVLLPMMCILYITQYLDKNTLSTASILGIRNHITTDEYNWLGTVFYLGYLAFEFPQNMALQRFPAGKWLSLNIIIWGIALCLHAACKNFTGLVIVRLILGICEGSITAGFILVSGMFYTRKEQTTRVGYWFLMNGVAQIIAGFIGFAVLHVKSDTIEAWQWLMIVTGALTFLLGIFFWFFFPDSPTNAWFLSKEDKELAVRRIKANQTGVENKVFKKEQMIEAFTDPKTWMFALYSALTNIGNSISLQRPIIINSFSFTELQTTLLGTISGVVEILTIGTGVNLAARLPNSVGYVAAVFKAVNLPSMLLLNLLSWNNKVGLLITLYTASIGTTAFVLTLSWLSTTTAGHTKRVTVNAIMLSAYCVGNAAGPAMWKDKYKPRNHVPWIIIMSVTLFNVFLLLTIRWTLYRRNKQRNAEPYDDTYDNVYMQRLGKDGKMERVKVDKNFLNLTDFQNRDFRYSL
jgi:MFS transporter, ACS family, allantoate permease